ncbi:MAG: hypothetical protein ACKOS8_10375 [Gemmataceae bacterium]
MSLEKQGSLQFNRPEGWKVERESDGETGCWRLTLQSPGTAFLLLTSLGNDMDSTQAAEATLESLKSDYPGLEAEEVMDKLAGVPATGYEVQFGYLDDFHTCQIRCFETANDGTVLALWQFSDIDAEEFEEPLLELVRGIRQS